jgi:hypothetical protein
MKIDTTANRRVTQVEQDLPTLPKHLGSPLVYSGVRVARALVFCVVLCRSPFVLYLLTIVLYQYTIALDLVLRWPLFYLFCSSIVINDVIVTAGIFERNESVRFGAVKSDSTHHFFGNACSKSGSLRFSQFSGCWLILSVYILMSFVFPFGRLFGVR